MQSKFYFLLLLVGGATPLVVLIFALRKKYEGYLLPIFCWLFVRLVTDIIVFGNRENGSSVYSPFVHLSILVETILLIHFFLKNSSSLKYGLLLYLFPILVFVLETQVFSSIFQPNRIAIFSDNFLIVLLMFVLLFKQTTLKKSQSIVKLLFLYHAIAVVYFIFIKQLRVNLELMQLIYPVFLVVITSFNLLMSLLFWSKAKH